MQEACGQAKANLSAAISDSLAEITCHIPQDAKVQIEFGRLVQVLQNLIGNAIHYRDENRRAIVEVTAQLDGTLWQISVHDNGMGIDKRFFQTVFEPFRRLHGNEKPGTGLGLATCKRTVERAKGTIWLDSTLGHGSTFFTLLPNSPTDTLPTVISFAVIFWTPSTLSDSRVAVTLLHESSMINPQR